MSIPDPGPAADLILWRAYVPRWSYAPLSGEGAARYGGRWNAVGQPCLYAARELSTAWAEYNQGFVQHPALIAQLAVRQARLFDLTDRKLFDLTDRNQPLDDRRQDIHATAWRADMASGTIPATHRLAHELQLRGWDGVIYPSFMSPGGTCPALWRWNSAGAPAVEVIDPEERLPKSALSWV